MPENEYLGSFKYEGKLVEGGILEASAAAKALSGIDSSLKFFVTQERPDLGAFTLPIPVKIQEGSWEALVPSDILGWIKTAGGIALSTYLYAAAKKMAENDFKDKGLKDVFQKALVSMQWLIKLGKHLGHLAIRNLDQIKWDREGFIGVVNEAKEVLYIPIDIFKRLTACPKNILSDLVGVVEIERTLRINVYFEKETSSVEITKAERFVFFEESDSVEVLFPELIHGMQIELEGVVTRGNEMSNTIGFYYNGHILTCSPRKGSIVRYKSHLFLSCRIIGEITRANKNGVAVEHRPRIIFENLTILNEKQQLELDMPTDDQAEET